MRTLFTFFMIIVVAIVVGGYAIYGDDEVVKIYTYDANGIEHKTSIWVVDDNGLWIRSGRPTSRWLTRLKANPDIKLEREGEILPYRAVPLETEAATDRVNELMAEKYGLGDKLVSYYRDPIDSVPIRLYPIAEE